MAFLVFICFEVWREEVSYVAKLFGERGHRTELVADVESALQLIDEGPDVLLTPYYIGRHDASTLVREMRHRANGKPTAAFLWVYQRAEVGGVLRHVAGDTGTLFDGVLVQPERSRFVGLFADQLVATIGHFLYRVGLEPTPIAVAHPDQMVGHRGMKRTDGV